MPSKNTKKKLKESARSQQPPKVEETVVNDVATTETVAEAGVAPAESPKVETPKVEQKQQQKQDKKKEKKPSKIKTKSKELVSELKKVTWPTFKQVAKKTGVVLVVVAVFALVLLGIHELLQLVYHAFIEHVMQ